MIIFLSGGSAVNYYCELLRNIPKDCLQIAPIDERWERAGSNMDAVAKLECLGGLGDEQLLNLHRKNFESMEAMAAWYENWWREVGTRGDELWGVLGVGEDGHTAGIMPMSEDEQKFDQMFVSTQRYVVGYDAGEQHMWRKRVTVTYKALDLCKKIIVYAEGEKKKAVINKLEQNKRESLAKYPALYLCRRRGVEWVVR